MLQNRKGRVFRHLVDRLAFDVDQPYDRFRQRYEKAVPELDLERLMSLVQHKAPWEAVVVDAQATTPLGFFIFWKLDTRPVMSLAGHANQCTEYLMGNHTIAERMFRFDPSIMLYAPLRKVIYVDHMARTKFAVDRPSSIFSSFENSEIAKVGNELDNVLRTLLRSLDVDVSIMDGGEFT
jgi:hypothetical protein